MDKEFTRVAKEAINDLFEFVDDMPKSQKNDFSEMKNSIHNPKKFVNLYKKITGATEWDLPDAFIKYFDFKIK